MSRYRARIFTVVIATLLAVAVWYSRPAPGPDDLAAVQSDAEPVGKPDDARREPPPREFGRAGELGVMFKLPPTSIRPQEPMYFPLDVDALPDIYAGALAGNLRSAFMLRMQALMCIPGAGEGPGSIDREPFRDRCEWLADNDADDPRRWLQVALDAGDVRAASTYFAVHQRLRDQYDDLEWSAIEATGRYHLERARDAGDESAFATIASYKAGIYQGGHYPEDLTGALAHFYAATVIVDAQIRMRDEIAIYARGWARRESDVGTLQVLDRRIAEVSARIPSQVEPAKEIARGLLVRCCS